MFHIVHLITHRARTDTLEQCSNAGCMAQASTVIDVITTKASTYEFLEQIGFFVTAFG